MYIHIHHSRLVPGLLHLALQQGLVLEHVLQLHVVKLQKYAGDLASPVGVHARVHALHLCGDLVGVERKDLVGVES